MHVNAIICSLPTCQGNQPAHFTPKHKLGRRLCLVKTSHEHIVGSSSQVGTTHRKTSQGIVSTFFNSFNMFQRFETARNKIIFLNRASPKPGEVWTAPKDPQLRRLSQKASKAIDSSCHELLVGLMDASNIQEAHRSLATPSRHIGNQWQSQNHWKETSCQHPWAKRSWCHKTQRASSPEKRLGQPAQKPDRHDHWYAKEPNCEHLLPARLKQQGEHLPTSWCQPSVRQKHVIFLDWPGLLPETCAIFNLQVQRWLSPQLAQSP